MSHPKRARGYFVRDKGEPVGNSIAPNIAQMNIILVKTIDQPSGGSSDLAIRDDISEKCVPLVWVLVRG